MADKFVYFSDWCNMCEHFKDNETDDYCNECLTEPVNVDSHQPVGFNEKKEEQ